MTLPQNPIVVIPARMASTRLPDKPLAMIHGEAMIVHCWRRAVEADIGPVIVACAEQAIADVIEAAGGRAILTDPGHPSGSDRIFEALQQVDPDQAHDAVINVQGDLPTIEPQAVQAVFQPLENPEVDIATLAARISNSEERREPSVVKVAAAFAPGRNIARALYFSRAPIPWDGGNENLPLYHHIGLYGFRRAALARFVSLPSSILEEREHLEQLRALEAGMRIDVARVDTVPFGVDTPADLARARELLAPGQA
ncbi:3-deoxy-manno-octulosonate cytidylyltransferase [Pelagibius sp. Alg239-R121]|uniref:3-deoxy-manno-octulosonate cytidylyltransferase n=1 Tax=Pelagibius sp. Alg239-R121 TaxID=2993448 RepID=UPI0024A69B2C|nr:3-deoxy-manno-octulosonate cytidylyltransferase [Pelagibius sp. Alg239-R121]